MYFRRLFSDQKTNLVYSNGLNQKHLSSLFSDSGKRTASKIFNKLSRDTIKGWLSKQGGVANVAERRQQKFKNSGIKKANIVPRAVQQTQIIPKYNRNTNLIPSLSLLYIWEQHEVPDEK